MASNPIHLGLVVLLGVVLACGCGGDPCGGNAMDSSEDAPRIESMQLRNAPVEGDPWELVFITDFTDGDGDLGQGRAEFFLNSSSNSSDLQLASFFLQQGLGYDATSGRLGIVLRFNETVSDGADVNLATQLVDASGRRSNCYQLDLEFDVKAAAASLLPQGWSLARLASRIFGGAS